MSIVLVENNNTGHHFIYQNELNLIEGTKILNKITTFVDVKKNPFKAYLDRKKFIEFVHENTNKKDIIHFLYLDSLYKCPLIDKILQKDRHYIGTLHWIPNDGLRKTMLKKISKKLEYIIVHSEYLKEKLKLIEVENVIVIDYPSFIKEFEQKQVNKNDEKIIISCLGGTRSDKGLDILMDSFKYLDEISKNKLIFNICGIEQDIKFKDLEDMAKKNNINLICKNKFLTDDEYRDEIISSDIILLPYKKVFSGNSGPMTDGIYTNKYIVGPEQGNLGYLIKKYNLGSTFVQEDSKSLADVLNKLINKDLTKNHEYRKQLSREFFRKNHEIVYKKIK